MFELDRYVPVRVRESTSEKYCCDGQLRPRTRDGWDRFVSYPVVCAQTFISTECWSWWSDMNADSLRGFWVRHLTMNKLWWWGLEYVKRWEIWMRTKACNDRLEGGVGQSIYTLYLWRFNWWLGEMIRSWRKWMSGVTKDWSEGGKHTSCRLAAIGTPATQHPKRRIR